MSDQRFALLELSTMAWASSALSVVAELGVADAFDGEERDVGDVAAAVGAQEDALHRILRTLTSFGIFRQTGDRRFALAPMGELLASDHPESMRNIVRMTGAPWHWQAWPGLEDSVRAGGPAFDHVHGTAFFPYLEANPRAAELFHAAMTEFQRLAHAAVLEAYDFAGIDTLTDVGGSHGDLLVAILNAHPRIRGVLFDQPSVIERAQAKLDGSPVRERIELVGGDFFAGVPEGSSAYLLSTIIHDWDDDEAATILAGCRRAMAPGGRVLLAERVVADDDRRDFAKLMDLEMMVLPGGRERTEREYARLFERAGLRLVRVHRSSTPMHVIEAQAS